MSASRAFSLLLWLGLSGLILLVAALVRLALVARPDTANLHGTTDGLCIFVPVHGDVLSYALSYVLAIVLLGVFALGLRYVGRQAVALRSMKKNIATATVGEFDGRLRKVISGAALSSDVILLKSQRKMVFTAGLWRPRIFVTDKVVNALTDKELEAVLLHEEYHALRRDPLRRVLARALTTMLFFLPVLRDLANYHNVSKEIEADVVAIRWQRSKAHIASALCKLTTVNYSNPANAVAFTEAASIEARVEALGIGSWRRMPIALSTLYSSVVGMLLLLMIVFAPLGDVHEGIRMGISFAACPAWLVLYWATRSNPL